MDRAGERHHHRDHIYVIDARIVCRVDCRWCDPGKRNERLCFDGGRSWQYDGRVFCCPHEREGKWFIGDVERTFDDTDLFDVWVSALQKCVYAPLRSYRICNDFLWRPFGIYLHRKEEEKAVTSLQYRLYSAGKVILNVEHQRIYCDFLRNTAEILFLLLLVSRRSLHSLHNCIYINIIHKIKIWQGLMKSLDNSGYRRYS